MTPSLTAKLTTIPLAVTCSVIGLAGGCQNDPAGAGECRPTLSSLKQDVFSASCLGSPCHGAGDPVGALDLESDGLEARLVGATASTCERMLVVPGDPQASFLYEKAASASPECGAVMPLEGTLDERSLACVRDWIAGLDPNDCATCGGNECVDLSSDPA